MSCVNWLFFHLMIKPSDPLLFIAAGKNSQVHYSITKIDALVLPYFIVKYSLLLFFFISQTYTSPPVLRKVSSRQ